MIRKFNLALFIWDDVLDAVLVERTVLGPEIRLSERMPRAENTIVKLTEKLEALHISDLFVSVSLPRDATLLRTVSYPAVVADNLETMLPLELNRHLPLPENERALAWSTAIIGADLLLQMIAMKTSELTAHLAPFTERGLQIDYALPACAFISHWINPGPTLLIINETNHTELCLCGDGLVRDSALLTHTSDDAVLETAQRLMAAHRKWLGAEGVERIISAGPTPLSEKIKNELSVAFGLTAHPLNLPAEMASECQQEALLTALNEFPESLNLTKARTRKFTMSRRALTISALATLILVQLIAWPILYAQAPKRTEAKLNQQIQRLKKDAAPLNTVKTEVRQMRAELDILERLSKDQLSMMQVLKMVSDTLPEDAYLERIQFEKTGQLALSGRSKNPSTLSGLLLGLPFVKDIVSSNTKERTSSEYTDFTITFTLKEMNDA